MAGWMDVAENHVAPAGAWVPAAEWQSFLTPKQQFAFPEISNGLAKWDIHPPVYFWLLHVWALVFGMTAASSIGLNIVLAMATGLSLFGLARWASNDALMGAAVVAFWALSSNVVGVSLVARQYGLLALLTVTTIWAALSLFSSPRRPGIGSWLLLALLTCLGFGTHYQFLLMVAGTLVWFTVTCWTQWRRLALLYTSMAAGLALMMTNSGFLTALSVVESPSFGTPKDLVARLRLTVETTLGFFVSPPVANTFLDRFHSLTALLITIGLMALAIVGALAFGLRRRGSDDASATPGETQSKRLAAVASLGIWVLVCIIGLFLTGRSPGHAMGDRYLAMAWPLLAFLPVLLVRRLKPTMAASLVLCLAVALVPAQASAASVPPDTSTVQALLSPTNRIVVDTLARGVLPRVVIDAAPATLVYAGTQSQILGSVDEWSNELQPGDFVLSSSSYTEDPANRSRIRSELKKRFIFDVVEGPWPLTWWRIVTVK